MIILLLRVTLGHVYWARSLGPGRWQLLRGRSAPGPAWPAAWVQKCFKATSESIQLTSKEARRVI